MVVAIVVRLIESAGFRHELLVIVNECGWNVECPDVVGDDIEFV